MIKTGVPGEGSGDWIRLDTREQFDAQIERDKIAAMQSLIAQAMRIATTEFPECDPNRVVAAIVRKSWPLAEAKIDEEAAKIRRQIAPSLESVPLETR